MAVKPAAHPPSAAINFGLLFGMGWRSLRVYALTNYGVRLTDDEARAYREAFFRAYPGLRAWHRRVGDRVRRVFNQNPDGTHEVHTLGGRRRVLPVAKGPAENRYPNTTEALNTPVQGTGRTGSRPRSRCCGSGGPSARGWCR